MKLVLPVMFFLLFSLALLINGCSEAPEDVAIEYMRNMYFQNLDTAVDMVCEKQQTMVRATLMMLYAQGEQRGIKSFNTKGLKSKLVEMNEEETSGKALVHGHVIRQYDNGTEEVQPVENLVGIMKVKQDNGKTRWLVCFEDLNTSKVTKQPAGTAAKKFAKQKQEQQKKQEQQEQ